MVAKKWQSWTVGGKWRTWNNLHRQRENMHASYMMICCPMAQQVPAMLAFIGKMNQKFSLFIFLDQCCLNPANVL